MANWNEDLNSLFVMFHDFTITDVSQRDHEITLRVSIPIDQGGDIGITVILAGCSDLSCDYSTLKTDSESLAIPLWKRTSNDWTTKDPAVISALQLEVQSHIHLPPDHYELRSNSSVDMHGGRVSLGLLKFRALAFKLYDEANTEIDLSAWQARW